ncbi:MAG: anhydro-N-acetylmuramic acid kinase [Burkholderiales bacterium]|nr:anhydro-N-acetylmuramic acid kinase [Burkholderiales bacterium]
MGRELFAGVMSGTSLDGIDAVLADLAPAIVTARILASVHVDFPAELRRELFALQVSGPDELVRAARAAQRLAELYAQALRRVCVAAGVPVHDVIAAGVHGQTVRHRPREGWTAQLNSPARVAELTSMTVVADFRMRDIAAGGQGAPLVPAFHAAVFRHPERHRVVANLGGIANVTDLPPSGAVRGFDTGPGNVLLDLWQARSCGAPFDAGGRFAASGAVDAALLAALLAEPYLALPPPKSTGRDLFDAAWLDAVLGRTARAPADVQATLAAFTAASLAAAIREHCVGAQDLLLCGGGVRNGDLVARIRTELPALRVATTDAFGVASEHVEALAFAWLARETIAGRPGNLPAVTGAAGPRILGAIYPR